MKAIEADKVEQAIKDYWKAQVNKLPKPKNIEEHDEYVNRLDAILEHNDGLLKAINELPSAEQEAPDINVGNMDVISRTQAIEAIKRHKTAEQSQSGEVRNWTVDTCADAVKRLPSIHPDTTTHGSNVVKKGGNDEDRTTDELISRQQAIDFAGSMNMCDEISNEAYKKLTSYLDELPSVQSDDDRLERCRFEYVNACKILAHRTPDTSKKDINDAYAVVRALNPIFGEEGF